MEPTYLLIIGAPRSGTTLLAAMIGAHPKVAMLIEDRYFSIKKLTGKEVLANKLCIPNQLEMENKANYFSRIIKKMGLLKNFPTSFVSIEDYLKLPNIKIVGILRNPNEVISSIMKRGEKSKKLATQRWCKAVDIIYELKNKDEDNIKLVTYENLLTNTAEVLTEICEYTNLIFQDSMLEGYKYNILYPGQNSIDKSKIEKSENSMEFSKKNKKSYEKYIELTSV